MSDTVQNGKGSKSRISNKKKFNDNFDEIDWKKKPKELTPEEIEDARLEKELDKHPLLRPWARESAKGFIKALSS